MKPGRLWLVVACAAATLVTLAVAPAAGASGPAVVTMGGVTQPVYGYADAIRERVWVETTFDSDLDGENDLVTLDIIRPQASEEGLQVPVIMDASPYYTTVCRGNDSECIDDVDGDGLNDKWPLFYDNYFVPRGYAVVLLHMAGTGFSTGCPTTGGTPDNLSGKAAIDWLNGRATGRDADGNEVVADWHNGRSGMIGKSYDGTLANAVAATGVEGLATIVPISAISSWYDYTRSNGIRFNTNYPSFLSNAVTNPDRRAYCAAVRQVLNDTDGDETGDYTPFWAERDYVKDAANVQASVFVVHGINDNNVKPDHFSKWWKAISHTRRKLWLTQTGHVDPFDFRREEWVRTIHRWFDSELWGIKNGIRNEPEVDFERSADVWETYETWPDRSAKDRVIVRLRAGEPQGPGRLEAGSKPRSHEPKVFQTFVDHPTQSENTMVNDPEEFDDNRLVFLSGPLLEDVRISGTPTISYRASVNDVDTNFGAILVDYGEDTRVSRSGDGITTLSTEDCWGEASANDDPCYRQTVKRLSTSDREVVTKGILDAQNRDSYETEEPLVPGKQYWFDFPLLPEDYVFKAGHRIGLIVVGSYRSYSSVADQNRAEITVNVTKSSLQLPVVGGAEALARAGL